MSGKCQMCRHDVESNYASQYKAARSLVSDYKLPEDLVICKTCADEDIIRLKREKIFNPFFKEFSRLVNSMGYGNDETTVEAFLESFCSEHRALQSEMFEVFTKFVKRLAEVPEDMYYDPRNAWIQSWAKKAVKAWEF